MPNGQPSSNEIVTDANLARALTHWRVANGEYQRWIHQITIAAIEELQRLRTAEPPNELRSALRDSRRYVEAYTPRDVSEAHDRDLMLNSIDALLSASYPPVEGLRRAKQIIEGQDTFAEPGGTGAGLLSAEVTTDYVNAYRDHILDLIDDEIEKLSETKTVVCERCRATKADDCYFAEDPPANCAHRPTDETKGGL